MSAGRLAGRALLGALILLAACAEGEGPVLPTISIPKVTLPRSEIPSSGAARAPATPAVVAEGQGTGQGQGQGALPPDRAAYLPAPEIGTGVERVAIATTTTEVPSVYMALETPRGRPVSIVFAIDASNDQTPDDDPAIRITPSQGQCNANDLRTYRFEGDDARPVFSRLQAVRGVGPADLPAFMATQVSARLIDGGHAADLDQTRPQNVCTVKLWEQLVLASNEAAAGAAQPSGQ